ncbi:pyrroloquinoline quinone biosynthesis protein D [Saccharopolyspora kobensis]|uniref:Pyrroloquinoline quinone biosynthesis protein D n=1 Tax=Saccharopolyspora kobensis TaxID=146035 RepID=A0A1H5ZFW4_9PSEU|nr:pyrroloquinoline quinone biosynthesis protein D [Saccharopolyspora kobensis]SFF17833.1 pyrroloquinoline quinone biosynthesis protein D [Saccharopolyspora kobensis]
MGAPTGARPVRSSSRPALASHVRLAYDRSRGEHVLLGPEAVLVLNPPGASVVDLCDGRRTVADIVANLRGRYDRVADEEVARFLQRLVRKRYVELGDD